ncbi:efflux RND transporter periplasmic adaptor subunit [Geminocystis sp. NIES-3709]|uniref:efflux RND transporter periplasmic adaptor subunit n=1 Tax=Geminocystis sp. NIES-3709 TaxID=1617448 RepID=UPI0005FC3B87|nr:efflux RND transporter periplasmic adaptor subunit [Geminocystis sp. NIES-3709]BAQ65946.1 probable RND efflux membrane fusion protein [Geminocystis sp. NIES-3709]
MTNPNSPPTCEESNIEQEKLQVTPSSHETTQQSSSRWRIVLIFLFVALVAGGGGKLWLASNNKEKNAPSNAMTAGQPQALPVKLETLSSQSLEDSTTVIGTLDAPRAVTVKSEISGRVNQILVSEGGRVQAGEVILTVESDELQAELFQAKAQLQNAQARLSQLKTGSRTEDIAEAKAQLNQSIARLNNAKEGAIPEEIAQAKAQVESAKAELDLAQERIKRYRNLEQEGAISQDQFDERLKTERQAMAALTEAQRRLSALSKGRQADLNELEAEVEQARQNLKRLENGARIEEIAQAEADVAESMALIRTIDVKIKKTEIVAPFTGIIGDIPIKLGDYVESGDELTTITENNVLEVDLSVPLEQAKELQLGLPVVILDGEGEAVTSGKISFISPNVTANSQLVLAKATLENGSTNLFNRGSVQAKIIWDQRQGILIPSAAVSRLGGKTFVFVAESAENSTPDKPQLIAKQKLVTLGTLQGNNYQVLKGLQVGEQIITAGILNLSDEAPVMPLK